MPDSFSDLYVEVLIRAQQEAVLLGDPEIGTEHLLVGLMLGGRTVSARILAQNGVDLAMVRGYLAAIRKRQPNRVRPHFSEDAQAALQTALSEARRLQSPMVTTDHLFMGILLGDSQTPAVHMLTGMGVAVLDVLQKLYQEHPGATPPDDDGSESPLLEDSEAPTLDFATLTRVLDELQTGLAAAFKTLQSRRAADEDEEPWPLADDYIEPEFPMDEESFQVPQLVSRILARGVFRQADHILMQPAEARLDIIYATASGSREVLGLSPILRYAIPFRVMRMARLNPMEKRRELYGQLQFPHQGSTHFLRVHSEPILKGVRVRVQFVR